MGKNLRTEFGRLLFGVSCLPKAKSDAPDSLQSPSHAKRAGFSLLELLVALVLLGIVGAGLASALRLGTQTYGRAQALDTDGTQAATRAQLRRLLSEATPPNLLTPFPNSFRGSAQKLSFVTLAPLGFARDAAGLRVTLGLENRSLNVTLEPFDDDGGSLRQYRSEIAEDVETLSISYFVDDTWLEGWDNTATLPQLVRVELGTETLWPEFTVELIYAN